MATKGMILLVLIPAWLWGQGLPNRDELVEKFVDPGQTTEGAQALIEHYQLGGVRTIIRNMHLLPDEWQILYAHSLRHLDLFRFRNDLNAQLAEADDDTTRSVFLMMLATFGRQLDPSIFLEHLENDSAPLSLRLAAGSGLVKAQKPEMYEAFLDAAKKVEYDPQNGINDYRFADIDMSNQGFYYYVKGQINAKPDDAHILTCLYMAENRSVPLFTQLLDMRKKKLVPLMIDRAIQVGGVALLDVMLSHKTCKRDKDEIKQAMGPAKAIAQYRAKFMDMMDPGTFPIGPLLPPKGTASGVDDYRSAYALLKVSLAGEVEVAEYFAPFGNGGDNLKALAAGVRTYPGYVNWEAAETFGLLVAP